MMSKKKTNQTTGIPVTVMVLGGVVAVFLLAWFVNQSGLGGSLKTAARAVVKPEIKHVVSTDLQGDVEPSPRVYRSARTWGKGDTPELAKTACAAKLAAQGCDFNARASGIRHPKLNCDPLNFEGKAIDGGSAYRKMTNDIDAYVNDDWKKPADREAGGGKVVYTETGDSGFVTCVQTECTGKQACGRNPKPSSTPKSSP